MSLTLSHQSALDVIRKLRSDGVNLNDADVVALARPSSWAGAHWSAHNFDPEVWRWPRPSKDSPLHVLVPAGTGSVRSSVMRSHVAWYGMPRGSIIWLDDHSSVVSPELLFLQMASVLTFPMVVLLGYELCGHFSRSADNPLLGNVTDGLPAVTSVGKIGKYLGSIKRAKGVAKARRALRFVCDHAISAPESVLATIYSLPTTESGYGMGPLSLNASVNVSDDVDWVTSKTRFPDLMFCFAPVGINYDGEDHLDLSGLVAAVRAAERADGESYEDARRALSEGLSEVRAKAIDDNMRNRQLLAQGKIVLPATKEDLYGKGHLDYLTRQLLDCARVFFGADVRAYETTLNNTEMARDRQELLDSMLPGGCRGGISHGLM